MGEGERHERAVGQIKSSLALTLASGENVQIIENRLASQHVPEI